MMDFLKGITISVLLLKVFKLCDIYHVMIIYAENLVSLIYKGGMPNDIFLCNTQLADIKIGIYTQRT